VLHVSNPNNLTYTFNLLNAIVANGNSKNAGTTVSDKSGAGLWKPSVNEAWQVVTIRIFHSRFTNNNAIQVAQDDGGGAIYATGAAEVSVVGSSFDGNSGSNGGAMYSLVSKNVNLYDSTFSDNTATGTGGNPGNGGNGGSIGVDGDGRNLNLCRVKLIGNHSNVFGAGLFTVTYSATSFTRVLNSTFDANESTGNALGGGAYIQGSPITIRGSTFSNNLAGGYTGLALFGQGGVLKGDITNSTFSGNIARTGLGGAMSIQSATSLLLQNVTIADNQAPCSGCFDAGISNDSGAKLTMNNVLFWNNTAGNAFNPWAIQNAAAAGTHNLQWPQSRGSSESDALAAPGTTFADAQLMPLADNGGFTQTMAIPANSPAVDTADTASAPATDQRGVARYRAPDIGAYEFRPDEIFADGFGD
jgi:predicted outer membrane repeat protein